MSAHTPGPWETVEITGCIYIETEDWEVAQLLHLEQVANPQTWADARLIAAAPDLLAALDEARDHIDAAQDGLLQRIDEAIAKATGEAVDA